MTREFQQLRSNLGESRPVFLGSYAATNPTEFFSVASEKFFLLPAKLRHYHPELFHALREFYGVDPSKWFNGSPGHPTSPQPTSHPETDLTT